MLENKSPRKPPPEPKSAKTERLQLGQPTLASESSPVPPIESFVLPLIAIFLPTRKISEMFSPMSRAVTRSRMMCPRLNI